MSDNATGRYLRLLSDEEASHAIAERLLLGTLDDLESIDDNATTYRLLGVAAVLRRTLVDATPLVNAARRRLRLPAPSFSYSPHHPEFVPPFDEESGRWTHVLGFARHHLAQPVDTGPLSRFLAAPAARFQGEDVSVRRVIRYFANVQGGVHVGRPSDEFERMVQQVVASVPEASQGWSETISAIARVTAGALQPLAEAIRARPIE